MVTRPKLWGRPKGWQLFGWAPIIWLAPRAASFSIQFATNLLARCGQPIPKYWRAPRWQSDQGPIPNNTYIVLSGFGYEYIYKHYVESTDGSSDKENYTDETTMMQAVLAGAERAEEHVLNIKGSIKGHRVLNRN